MISWCGKKYYGEGIPLDDFALDVKRDKEFLGEAPSKD